DAWQDRWHHGRGYSAAQSPEEGPVSRAERGEQRNQKGADPRPDRHRGDGEARVSGPARATFVEGLDFARPNRPSDTVVGGYLENQLVDIEGGRMTIKFLSGLEPQAQWMPRRSSVSEVIGQRDVDGPGRVGHQSGGNAILPT